MAGLDFGVGDGAVCLNLDEQYDFATDVHAVREFGIDGGDAGDYCSMDVAGEGGANAKEEASREKERADAAGYRCQSKPPGTEAVSAGAAEALAGDEDGGDDLGEGEVFGGAAGALLPVEEEFAVAVGEAGGVVDLEFGEGPVDPFGRAFELGVVADGGFIDDQVNGGVRGGIGVGPLGAVFLVDEGGDVAELLEDGGEGGAIGDGGFSLDADLVASEVVGLVGQAFVGEGPEVAVLAEAENLTLGAEFARGSVVENVAFEGAGRVETEAELG